MFLGVFVEPLAQRLPPKALVGARVVKLEALETDVERRQKPRHLNSCAEKAAGKIFRACARYNDPCVAAGVLPFVIEVCDKSVAEGDCGAQCVRLARMICAIAKRVLYCVHVENEVVGAHVFADKCALARKRRAVDYVNGFHRLPPKRRLRSDDRPPSARRA